MQGPPPPASTTPGLAGLQDAAFCGVPLRARHGLGMLPYSSTDRRLTDSEVPCM